MMSNANRLPELQIVALAGGSGTRLWPLSRHSSPKQFLCLADNSDSMMQQTLKRVASLSELEPIIICNDMHRFLVAEQLRQLEVLNPKIILEPQSKNTAPAIALACLQARKQSNDPVMLILAADHVIKDVKKFHSAIHQGYLAAAEGSLVTFGIIPTHPETGYGYIEKGDASETSGFKIKRFVEKPESTVAQKYFESGEYLWNSGIFMFRASRYLEVLSKFSPCILKACEKAFANAEIDLDFIRLDVNEFAKSPEDSIDYAVMEKAEGTIVVPLAAGWSDVGSWSSLWDVSEKSADGNVLKGDVICKKTKNSYIHSSSRLVAVLGIEDLVVVETKDAVLVAKKDSIQNVKDVVASLKSSGRSEHLFHREVYRPWGHFDSIDAGDRYQVKRITVKPGAKLSVQMHHHRAEHWIVVSGVARVTNGDKNYLVTENQSTYIPIGQVHSLENPGVIPLELIEVQSGSYLGEDDIVRFEDLYGRT